ncbi:MAG: tetratricopeptide repeat protein [Elainellaceae cyanobacterium]
MVNIEELLKRLQQAETEMDRQWVLLELQMSQMSDEMTSMLWAAAVPHFFDAKVLAALRPELQDRADELYAALKTLTFVEEFPKYGHNVHELTRDVLLSQLWRQNQAEFLRLSEQLADYFFDRETSSEEDVEFAYHEILSEGHAQRGRLLDQVIRWWDYHQIDRIQTALQRFSEHEKAGRLDEFGNGFLLHLNGLLKSKTANYKEAELYFSRAEAIYKNKNLKNSRYITTLLRDIGTNKKNQGDNKSATSTCEQVLRICEEQFGKNHPDTAISLNNLAILYHDTGRLKEAELLHLRSLKIREEQFGENHPDTANSLNNLALLYQATGRSKEAEQLHLRSLKIREEQFGKNHPNTATSLNNLAGIYLGTLNPWKVVKAVFLQTQSLKIKLKTIGWRHPSFRVGLLNLLSILMLGGMVGWTVLSMLIRLIQSPSWVVLFRLIFFIVLIKLWLRWNVEGRLWAKTRYYLSKWKQRSKS